MGNKDSAVLRDDEFATIANATGMTVDDVEKHYMDFLQANGSDGQISKKEFEETVKKFQPKINGDQIENSKKLRKYVFRMYDTDESGSIDFNEFMTVFYLSSCNKPDEKLKMIFRVFDKNQDKAIKQEEVGKIVKILYKLLSDEDKKKGDEKQIAEEVFKEMDKDADQKVTEAEFLAAVNKAESLSKVLTDTLADVVGFEEPRELVIKLGHEGSLFINWEEHLSLVHRVCFCF